eukprot:gene5382-9189_t
MKIFICKWPDFDITIIRAENIREAKVFLDEFGDPGSCIISEYEGPMVFDFRGPNLLKKKSSHVPFFIEGEEVLYNGRENEYVKPQNSFYSKYFNKNTFSDIKLLVEKKEIPSHKIVLSQFPNFTEDILNCDELEIDNISYEQFMIILYFMYHNHLDGFQKTKEQEKYEFWLDCFKFAKKLKLTRLTDLIQLQMVYLSKERIFQNNLIITVNENEAKELLKVVHLSQPYGAIKFIYFALEMIASSYDGDVEKLDSKYGEKMKSYKTGYTSIWNEKAIQEMKEIYPFNFRLNHRGGDSSVPRKMWEKIQLQLIPDLHKSLWAGNQDFERVIDEEKWKNKVKEDILAEEKKSLEMLEAKKKSLIDQNPNLFAAMNIFGLTDPIYDLDHSLPSIFNEEVPEYPEVFEKLKKRKKEVNETKNKKTKNK